MRTYTSSNVQTSTLDCLAPVIVIIKDVIRDAGSLMANKKYIIFILNIIKN